MSEALGRGERDARRGELDQQPPDIRNSHRNVTYSGSVHSSTLNFDACSMRHAEAAAILARAGQTTESVRATASSPLPLLVEIVAQTLTAERGDDEGSEALVWARAVRATLASYQRDVETTMPWAREIELCDPDGNRLRIGTPRSAATSRTRQGERCLMRL